MKKTIKLYNSLSNSLEDFIPIDENNIKIYACGPTVYSSPHIGNARPLVIFDVLFRLLKKLYKNVVYVRNITDVDDKINAGAREKNISIKELTDKVIDEFQKNSSFVNLLPVTHEPRATLHIQDMLNIVQKLINNGFAYESQGHVLFRIKQMPQYGMLSKRNLDEMIAGSRIEIAPYKENPMDFVLWKPSDQDQDNAPSWDSPFGKGRPGWHLECSAMSYKYLGEKFDIHVGGQDLLFPHHENEIAQNFGAFGCLMANYWLHNGMLTVDGQKMSKSLGNIISLNDILKRYDGEIIRYAILSAHYQKTLDWTEESAPRAKRALDKLYGALQLADNLDKFYEEEEDYLVVDELIRNLNTPLALCRLQEIATQIYKTKKQDEINKLCVKLKKEAETLGLQVKNADKWFQIAKHPAEISEAEIEKLINARQKAKSEKNFQLADEIRKKLLDKNIQIEDSKTGTTWRATS
ncbi:MAG: cysteine--tRNA ligase [Holosporaceae bacterium]|jgi:cysteinyl-tRNA synthetase|nr:cysteine--tRNA ligase [Holosporaceae bacterium]